MDDNDLIIHILYNMPKEYDMVVEQLEDDLQAKGSNKLMLEQVRDKLCLKFQRLKINRDNEDDKEAALAAYGKYKKMCRICGKEKQEER